MFDRAHLGWCRQQLVEMAAPTSRIFTVTMAAHFGEIAICFPSAAATGLAVSGFFVQIGSSTLSTRAVSTACYRQSADDRVGICR